MIVLLAVLKIQAMFYGLRLLFYIKVNPND
jgi:hypothetical protein